MARLEPLFDPKIPRESERGPVFGVLSQEARKVFSVVPNGGAWVGPKVYVEKVCVLFSVPYFREKKST